MSRRSGPGGGALPGEGECLIALTSSGWSVCESALNRDYPVMFGTLYIFTLLGFLIKLLSDLTMTWVDPRIDFNAVGGR